MEADEGCDASGHNTSVSQVFNSHNTQQSPKAFTDSHTNCKQKLGRNKRSKRRADSRIFWPADFGCCWRGRRGSAARCPGHQGFPSWCTSCRTTWCRRRTAALQTHSHTFVYFDHLTIPNRNVPMKTSAHHPSFQESYKFWETKFTDFQRHSSFLFKDLVYCVSSTVPSFTDFQGVWLWRLWIFQGTSNTSFKDYTNPALGKQWAMGNFTLMQLARTSI